MKTRYDDVESYIQACGPFSPGVERDVRLHFASWRLLRDFLNRTLSQREFPALLAELDAPLRKLFNPPPPPTMAFDAAPTPELAEQVNQLLRKYHRDQLTHAQQEELVLLLAPFTKRRVVAGTGRPPVRREAVKQLIAEKGDASSKELQRLTGASPSTIRRAKGRELKKPR